MPDTSPRYFLSYSRRDQDFAGRLARDLSGHEQDVFFDQISIPAGADWTSSIQSALDACDRLLLVLSPAAVASRNVLDETRYALDHGKRVVPVLRQECELPFWLWRIEYVDFQGIYEDAFGKLVAELRKEPHAAILPVEPASPAMAAPRLASGRNIVVCFDHQLLPTFDLNGNAFALTRMAVSASDRQIVYYDPGIEMLGGIGRWSEFRQLLRRNLRVWLGRGIAQHVEHAYAFLMDTYRPGDRLFLFGSSIGGLMARTLADVLDTFGLLDKAGAVVVPYAVRGLDRVTAGEARDFKTALSRDCDTYFFGMWDCVQGLGASRRGRSRLRLSPRTAFGYHAVAIDEQRRGFLPLLWKEPAAPDQTVEQVWFAGAHADVCGGYAETGLSDLALRWMVEKANACGMLVSAEGYGRLAPDPLAPMHDSFTGPWRLFGREVRRIPEGALVHPSVLERQRQRGYAPKNLTAVDQRPR